MAEKRKNKLFNSLEEIKKELFERSVWPTRQEVINQTVVVIILLIITSTFLGAADYIVTLITRTLLDGSIIASIMSSTIALVLIVIAVALFVMYFAIRYVRKNRYNR